MLANTGFESDAETQNPSHMCICEKQYQSRESYKILWASSPGRGLGISASMIIKTTTVLLKTTKLGSTQLSFGFHHNLGPIRISPHLTFRWFGIKLSHWLGCSYSSRIENVSTVVFLRAWLWLVSYAKTLSCESIYGHIWIKREEKLRTFASCESRQKFRYRFIPYSTKNFELCSFPFQMLCLVWLRNILI